MANAGNASESIHVTQVPPQRLTVPLQPHHRSLIGFGQILSISISNRQAAEEGGRLWVLIPQSEGKRCTLLAVPHGQDRLATDLLQEAEARHAARQRRPMSRRGSVVGLAVQRDAGLAKVLEDCKMSSPVVRHREAADVLQCQRVLCTLARILQRRHVTARRCEVRVGELQQLLQAQLHLHVQNSDRNLQGSLATRIGGEEDAFHPHSLPHEEL
mmetsp:Transcript_64533/g.154147  ORF Transcript_64533/g.154147 Transcript_64533/m.154147 type:complete len:214 (-) Transcript_64533:1069-1710(-)